MNKFRFIISGSVLLFLTLLVVAVSTGSSASAVLRSSLFAGSGGVSSVGDVSVNGSMGQAIVGSSAAKTAQLTSGYWWSPFTFIESDNLLYLPLTTNNYCGGFGGPREQEDNDNPGQANGPLCFGLHYMGSIYHDNENEPGENTEDWFFIEWNGAGTLQVQVTNFPARAQVRLYHQANLGSSVGGVANRPDGNYTFEYGGAAGSGRYYIRLFVSGQDRPVGTPDYKLTVLTQ